MTFPPDPRDRLPRGDKDRRLAIGVSREDMARAAHVTVERLRDYEHTQPHQRFSLAIARRVGAALEAFEATRTPRVDNGPVPSHDAD